MSEDGGDGARSGCPAHSIGLKLAWTWTRQMPPALKGGFLTLLYALRAVARKDGALAHRDGQPVRIQDIAQIAGCREKDARRYLDAGVLAGVVVIVGDRRRGRATLYAIVDCPSPRWQDAAAHLKATARPRPPEAAGSGHSGPNSGGEEVRATAARTGEDEVRATAARMGSGHSGPNRSGHSGPNNTGVHEQPRDMADVVPQPLDAGAGAPTGAGACGEKGAGNGAAAAGPGPSAGSRSHGDAPPPGRWCACGVLVIRGGDQCHGCRNRAAGKPPTPQGPVQGAILTVVPSGAASPPAVAPGAIPYPREDPSAPPRTCGCGRTYRTAQPGLCPDCVAARHLEQAGTG